MNFTIHNGDNRDILKTLDDNSIDAIVTDPPYGIDFLGKSWDANTGALETYTECLRVLKPGGYILAFSAARTYHHLAVTLEQAGFEIRDQLMWLYSSGFPKAQDIGKAIDKRAGKTDPNYGTTNNNGTSGGINLSFTEDHIGGSRRCNRCNKDVAAQYNCKDAECGLQYNPQTSLGQQWAGWKTALKPGHEPICMARKPFKGSTIDNVLEHGLGALNIDATRIATDETLCGSGKKNANGSYTRHQGKEFGQGMMPVVEYNGSQGRFPSNVLGEVEGYQKFFYCPKVSRKERHVGFEDPGPRHPGADGGGYQVHTVNDELIVKGEDTGEGNNHPTVKPVELMKYLIKLVTPPNSTVLDPFTGSGSTGMAAVELGHTFIGCDLDPNYVRIAETRIAAWNRKDESEQHFESLFECL